MFNQTFVFIGKDESDKGKVIDWQLQVREINELFVCSIHFAYFYLVISKS